MFNSFQSQSLVTIFVKVHEKRTRPGNSPGRAFKVSPLFCCPARDRRLFIWWCRHSVPNTCKNTKKIRILKKELAKKWHQFYFLTICPEDERCRRAVNFALCDAVHHDTSVVAHVGRLHLGDVKVSCLLRDEAAIVLLDEVRVFVKHPCICKICDRRGKRWPRCNIFFWGGAHVFRWFVFEPPEDVGVPQSNTTPCPSRTDTALLVWTLKWSKSVVGEKTKGTWWQELTYRLRMSGTETG